MPEGNLGYGNLYIRMQYVDDIILRSNNDTNTRMNEIMRLTSELQNRINNQAFPERPSISHIHNNLTQRMNQDMIFPVQTANINRDFVRNYNYDDTDDDMPDLVSDSDSDFEYEKPNVCRQLFHLETFELPKKTKDLCNVCLDKFNVEQEVYVLPCGHMYHMDCLDKWLDNKTTCPSCRYSVYGKKIKTNLIGQKMLRLYKRNLLHKNRVVDYKKPSYNQQPQPKCNFKDKKPKFMKATKHRKSYR